MKAPLTQATLLRRRCQRILADQRRRARADGVTLSYGLDELLTLSIQQTCTYCWAPLGMDFQLDHLTPVARGGKHELENLAAACKKCNVRKGVLLASEYRRLLILVGSWPPAAQEDIRRRLVAGGAAVYARNRRKKM